MASPNYTPICVQLEDSVLKSLNEYCLVTGCTRKSAVNKILQSYIKQDKKERRELNKLLKQSKANRMESDKQ